MMVCLIIGSILSCGLLIIGSSGQKMLGAGRWAVLNVQPCARDAEMPWQLRVRRHKMNRTHDGFDVDFSVKSDFDNTFAIRLDVCKFVDGGCKPYTVMEDDCLPTFVKKHAKGNVKEVLTRAGLDPPDFPVPKGEYHMQDLLLNYEDLPEDGIYGEFGVDGYVVKDGEDMACAQLSLKYEPVDDDKPSQYG